jgi:hypothetical protein
MGIDVDLGDALTFALASNVLHVFECDIGMTAAALGHNETFAAPVAGTCTSCL